MATGTASRRSKLTEYNKSALLLREFEFVRCSQILPSATNTDEMNYLVVDDEQRSKNPAMTRFEQLLPYVSSARFGFGSQPAGICLRRQFAEYVEKGLVPT